MTHPDMEAQVDAYLDGELAAGDAAELEAHLAECASCRRFRADRLALRSAIAAEMPRLAAPDALRARVRTAWRAEAAAGRPRRSVTLLAPTTWRWLALAASLAVVAVGSWRLGSARAASASPGRRGAGEPRPLAHARPPERRGVLRPAHREAVVRRQARLLAAGARFRRPRLPAARRPARLSRTAGRSRPWCTAGASTSSASSSGRRTGRRARPRPSSGGATTCSTGRAPTSPTGSRPTSGWRS